MNAMLAEVDAGTYKEFTKASTSEYLKQWLTGYKAQLSRRAAERYDCIVNKHLIPNLGRLPLIRLQPSDLQEYYAKAARIDGKAGNLSPKSITYHHRVLHVALEQAVKWGMIPTNPAHLIKPPGTGKGSNVSKSKTLSMEQVWVILKNLEGTYAYLPVYLAAMTGMRMGELFGLRWSNVDLNKGVINVVDTLYQRMGIDWELEAPKTASSQRAIRIVEHTQELLKEHKEKQTNNEKNLVCTRDNGAHINPNSFSSYYRRMTTKLGLNTNFHALRHTHATQLLKLGVHPKVVSERLGHSTTRVTEDIYSHVLPMIQKEAAERFALQFLESKDPKPEGGS